MRGERQFLWPIVEIQRRVIRMRFGVRGIRPLTELRTCKWFPAHPGSPLMTFSCLLATCWEQPQRKGIYSWCSSGKKIQKRKMETMQKQIKRSKQQKGNYFLLSGVDPMPSESPSATLALSAGHERWGGVGWCREWGGGRVSFFHKSQLSDLKKGKKHNISQKSTF